MGVGWRQIKITLLQDTTISLQEMKPQLPLLYAVAFASKNSTNLNGLSFLIYSDLARVNCLYHCGLSDVPHSLTVHVHSLSNVCSVVMARCKLLHGNVDAPTSTEQQTGSDVLSHTHSSGASGCGDRPEGLGPDGLSPDDTKMVTVLFSLRCARFVGLVVGGRVRIHPPW